jgi:hypothetical protein
MGTRLVAIVVFLLIVLSSEIGALIYSISKDKKDKKED